jgi:hypothetical protein
MVKFDLPERKFVPDVDEIGINPHRLKQIIEDAEAYNKDCRLWKKYESDTGEEIPEKYRGRNRYWITAGEGQNDKIGVYTVISVYDLDPSDPDGRVLIAKYRPERAAYRASNGNEIDATPLQTLAQAEKHLKACKLEAERQERMAKKDPKLTSSIKAHIPLLYSPNTARKVIDARQK